MFFGLTFEKLLIIGVIAVFLLGPERLPGYAAQFARLIRSLRDMAQGAKERMRDEMGPEFDEVDWKKLDPRQYDPRRIIREALLDDSPPAPVISPPSFDKSASTATADDDVIWQKPRLSTAADRQRKIIEGETVAAPPFDLEAT
ncbi:sec-independent protein translocase protein TatB [Okibacterium sp. HSC-33S16]|uniref:Sec-independent protein translocase TatB n=1 Tax=Okibacterium sp. HSC-33S16 TaxID=2910965 RepID=UPI00209E9D7D|nr:Sec-independent protein translocase TatB [Okibacterium sp. HSC-33S16]MCP2030410.1 sec-independent protein translocase protein TatB [Okibacterium sp. HSC-33S16]